ncbi:hypothetical protein A2U01_0088553, partial [Trifolium medium]|nr:hypothetical protein [Trifolium medium]
RSRGIPPRSRWRDQCLAATGSVGAVQLWFPAATAGISVDRSGADPGSISQVRTAISY